MAQPTVGLVLRSKSVEVVQARTRWGPTRLTKLLTVPIVEGDEAQVVQAIRTALQNAGAAGSNVGVSVSAPEILVRSFTMPLLPRTEHETAVRFEVRKYIPFKPDDLVWNFHITEQRQTKRMHVAFVGVRAQTFAKIQRWLTEAGAQPAFLEATAVSVARLVTPPRPKSEVEGFTGLVDIDLTANTATIVFAKDQIPYFARDVNLLTDQEGFGTGPQVSDLRFKVLLSELRLSLDFFLREYPNVTIRRMVLFGDPAVLASWVSWLAEQLKCQVSVGTLPLLDQAGQEPLPQFACAVGLALRFRGPVRVRADFVERKPPSEGALARPGWLPQLSLQPVVEALTNPTFLRDVARGVLVQGAVAAAFLVLLHGLSDQRIRQIRASFQREVQTFPAVEEAIQRLPRASLEQLQRDLQGRAERLHALFDQRLLMTEKLDALAKRLPDGVWLDGLTYQYRFDERPPGTAALTLRGSCYLPQAGAELDVIARLASELKGDPRFAHGLPISQLGEIALRESGPNVTYRTFTFNYLSEPSL